MSDDVTRNKLKIKVRGVYMEVREIFLHRAIRTIVLGVVLAVIFWRLDAILKAIAELIR